MSWKKNVFSCLMWAVYLLIVGTAMIFTSRVICDSFGMAEYFDVIIPAVYLLFTGILVFGLHRMSVRLQVSPHGAGKGLAWMEGMLVLVLLAAGLFLRVTQLQSESFAMPEESAYLKLAYLSGDGQKIPLFSHGAVYLYIRALRLCFMLLGNKASAAVWLQITMQMLGVLLFHLAVRKMAGRIPAVMMTAFFMLSPYMVEKSLVPSPEMLYLLAFASVFLFISQGVRYVSGFGFWLAAGVLTAVLSYLDVAGILLLPLVLGVIFMKRQETERKIAVGLCGCLAGFLSGAAVCVFADAAGSGKPVSGIIRAWAELYRWEELQLSVTLSGFGIVWMITLLLCFMAWGIFGFWCGKGEDRFTVWFFCLCVTVLSQCLGIFTEEMSGFIYIFLFSTILAGLGIRESMTACPAENGKLQSGKAQDENGGADDLILIWEPENNTQMMGKERGTMGEKGNTEGKGRIETRGGTEAKESEETRGGTEAKESTETKGGPKAKESTETKGGPKAKESTETRGGTEAKESTEIKGRAESKEGTETGGSTEARNNSEKKPGGTEEKPGRRIEFLENPLPLPKRHEKRVMDYKLDSGKDFDGYDIDVSDDDDFDH